MQLLWQIDKVCSLLIFFYNRPYGLIMGIFRKFHSSIPCRCRPVALEYVRGSVTLIF